MLDFYSRSDGALLLILEQFGECCQCHQMHRLFVAKQGRIVCAMCDGVDNQQEDLCDQSLYDSNES